MKSSKELKSTAGCPKHKRLCHEIGTEGSDRMVLTPSPMHEKSALLILVKCTQTKIPTSANCVEMQSLTHISLVKQRSFQVMGKMAFANTKNH